MTETYSANNTALLLIDPYNDFMSEGGKAYGWIKDVAEKVNLFGNLRQILTVVRAAGIQVFILPHHRYFEGDYDGWKHMNPLQKTAHEMQAFAVDTWGGEFHPEFGPKHGDVIVKEHWSSSSFANTDLDALLKQHGLDRLIVVGLIANTCLESTARYGMELGYHVTLVRDATAAASDADMHAAHDVNGPMFAHAILSTAELIPLLPTA